MHKIINPSISDILRWVAGTMGQMNRRPSIWCSKYYFFPWFLAKYIAKSLSIHFVILFFLNTKIKVKSFECPKSVKILKKNNTWNIRRLVDDSFVQSAKLPSIIYLRLTDLKSMVGHNVPTLIEIGLTYLEILFKFLPDLSCHFKCNVC